MEVFKLGTKLKLLSIFCFVVLAYYNFSNIKCTYFGNLVFDKILNINNDCYKRKLKGVIYPSVWSYTQLFRHILEIENLNSFENSNFVYNTFIFYLFKLVLSFFTSYILSDFLYNKFEKKFI